MQLLRDKDKNGQIEWPDLDRTGYEYSWYHSDIKNQALPYVHNTLDKMIEILEGA